MLWPIGATDPRGCHLWPAALTDLGFLMQGMTATTRAKLLDLELLSLLLFVPSGHIVAPLAAVAR